MVTVLLPFSQVLASDETCALENCAFFLKLAQKLRLRLASVRCLSRNESGMGEFRRLEMKTQSSAVFGYAPVKLKSWTIGLGKKQAVICKPRIVKLFLRQQRTRLFFRGRVGMLALATGEGMADKRGRCTAKYVRTMKYLSELINRIDVIA